MPVHVCINEAENDGFVANQCLIMTLAIRDSLLIWTAILDLPEDGADIDILDLPEDGADIDILVTYLFNSFNPVVGYVHGHAVIEAVAAIFELGCQAGHTTHFLSNGDGLRIHLVNQTVGQRQVADSIVIFMTIEVISIASKSLTQTV